MCTKCTFHPQRNVHTAFMAQPSDRPGHFIRAWRKHRGYTLEQLAERIGMTHQNLGKIERFKVPYNQELLESLALELRCAPADLITRDPSDPDSLWSILDGLPPSERSQALRMLQAFKTAATGS
jgi:transcriptional regulator with XRE-family HTH domain